MNRVFVSLQDELLETAENARFFALVDSGKVEDFVCAVLEKIKKDGEEISVLFCDDEFIHEYNFRDRKIDSATDILEYENASEYEDDEGKWFVAGDMLISFETLEKNATYFGASVDEELKRLLVHGTLHLNGYDHGDAHLEVGVAPTDEMLLLQEKILADFADRRLLD